MTTPGHQVGALADEAGQLLDALADRLDRLKAQQVPGPPVERESTDEHPCVGWCPICRGAELLRGDRTEVSERLLDTAILVVGTLRSLIPEPTAATAPATPDQTSPAAPPGVERIDIR